MTQQQQPLFLPEEFCNNGIEDIDYIFPPITSADPMVPSLDTGFTYLQEVKPNEGGAVVRRQQFNGILKWLSEIISFTNKGGLFTFNTENIDGYAINDVLFDFATNQFVISLHDNNTVNFVAAPSKINNTDWKFITLTPENITSLVVQKINTLLTSNNSWSGINTFSQSPIIPTVATSDSSTKAASTAFVKAVTSALGSGITQSGSNANGLWYIFGNGLRIALVTVQRTLGSAAGSVTLPTIFDVQQMRISGTQPYWNGANGFIWRAAPNDITSFYIREDQWISAGAGNLAKATYIIMGI